MIKILRKRKSWDCRRRRRKRRKIIESFENDMDKGRWYYKWERTEIVGEEGGEREKE